MVFHQLKEIHSRLTSCGVVRLSNGDKMAILEAIRTPVFQRGGHNKIKSNALDIGFTEPYSVLLTPRKKIVIHLIFSK